MDLPTSALAIRTRPSFPTQVIQICGKLTLNQLSYRVSVVTKPEAGLSQLGSSRNTCRGGCGCGVLNACAACLVGFVDS